MPFMFPAINPTKTKAWEKLTADYQNKKNIQIADLFKKDSDRFQNYSIQTNHIF